MQTKNSFDKESLKKILKGALIAGTGAIALFLLDALGKVQIDNALLTSFIAWFIPVAVNTVKEWMKGE